MHSAVNSSVESVVRKLVFLSSIIVILGNIQIRKLNININKYTIFLANYGFIIG